MDFIQSGYNWTQNKEYRNTSVIPIEKKNRILVMIVRSKCKVKFENKPEQNYDSNIIVLANSGTSVTLTSHDEIMFINDWLECYTEENELLDKYNLKSNCVFDNLSDHQIGELTKIIFDITYEQHNKLPKHHTLIDTYLNCFFYKLFRYSIPDISENEHPRYDEFVKLRYAVLSNPQGNNKIDWLAKSVCLSESYFRKTYKQIFGTTIHQDIILSRIEFAKKNLKLKTKLSTYTIAKKSGFESYEHFLRQFKQYTGLTPSEYRTQNEHKKEQFF